MTVKVRDALRVPPKTEAKMVMEVVEAVMASLEAKFKRSLEGGVKGNVAEAHQDSVVGCVETLSSFLPKGSGTSLSTRLPLLPYS